MTTEPMTTEQPTAFRLWLLRDGTITEHVEGSPEFARALQEPTAGEGPTAD